MLTKLKLKKIDLYLLSEVIGPFLGGVAFFCFIFLMFQALRLAEFFIVHGVSALILAKMTGLLVISFLPIALPIAFLISVLVGFGRLSSDSELVAFKASGVSLLRMTLPVCALAFFVVLGALFLNLEWVPKGEREFKSLLIRVGNTKVVSSIKEGTFTSGFFDMLIFVDDVNRKTSALNRVFIYDEREARNPLAIVARQGEIVPVKLQSQLGTAAMLRLYGGNIHRNELDSERYQKIDFDEYRLYLKVLEGDDSVALKPKMLSYQELTNKLGHLDQSTREFRELRTEFWRRYAVAMSPFIFVFLGVGFGTVRTRSVRSGAVLIAFIVIVIYWTIQATMTSLSYQGKIPPLLAMNLPNIVMMVAAFWSYKKAAW